MSDLEDDPLSVVKKTLREFECFDEKMFSDAGGYLSYAVLMAYPARCGNGNHVFDYSDNATTSPAASSKCRCGLFEYRAIFTNAFCKCRVFIPSTISTAVVCANCGKPKGATNETSTNPA